MELQVGSILEGKVTSITKFGAFVALDNGKSGLVHISEIANTFVNDVHDYLQEGQAVKVLVLSTENGKVNLSIKRTLPRPERPARSPRPSGSHPAGDPDYDHTAENKLTLLLHKMDVHYLQPVLADYMYMSHIPLMRLSK